MSINLINPQKLPLNVEVKIRYKSNLAKAKIVALKNVRVFCDRKKHGQAVKVIFDKPQQAITPGQSAVFYKGNYLLGGGIIE